MSLTKSEIRKLKEDADWKEIDEINKQKLAGTLPQPKIKCTCPNPNRSWMAYDETFNCINNCDHNYGS